MKLKEPDSFYQPPPDGYPTCNQPKPQRCWCGEPIFRDGKLCKAHAAERLLRLGIKPSWR